MKHTIGFWNVENLFDVEGAPDRSDKLQSKLGSELVGWNADILKKKIDQLSSIVVNMAAGGGPHILGVCEVENRTVLQKFRDGILAAGGRQYEIAHEDNNDKRGIDVAFLYDPDIYEIEETFSHALLKREATRDIFQANLRTKATGRLLVLMGNHWPSRRGGKESSAPFRMMAGETLAYFHQRCVEENGRNVAVVAMGDFNDEPFDRSVEEYALSIRERLKVTSKRSRRPYFLNLMWELMGRNIGTHSYNNFVGMLDQFWVSRGIAVRGGEFDLVRPETGTLDSDSSEHVAIFTGEPLKADGLYLNPERFARPSVKGGANESGYSDHFPILMTLEEN